jgi:hypothetical protein
MLTSRDKMEEWEAEGFPGFVGARMKVGVGVSKGIVLVQDSIFLIKIYWNGMQDVAVTLPDLS